MLHIQLGRGNPELHFGVFVMLALTSMKLTLLVLVGVRPAWRTLAQTPVQMREVDAQLDQMRRLADEAAALRQRPRVARTDAARVGQPLGLGLLTGLLQDGSE